MSVSAPIRMSFRWIYSNFGQTYEMKGEINKWTGRNQDREKLAGEIYS